MRSRSPTAAACRKLVAMFIGHIAVGLAAKRLAPKTSLGLLVAAPVALDLLWPQ